MEYNYALTCVSVFIVIISLIAFSFVFFIGKSMHNNNKTQMEWLSLFPKYSYSEYSEYSFCGKCRSANRMGFNPVCGKCGEETARVIGRWKIKEHAPLPLMGVFGELVCIGPGYKEKVEFVKKSD